MSGSPPDPRSTAHGLSPRVSLSNRQRLIPLPFLPELRRFAREVVPACLASPGGSPAVLRGFTEVGIVLVSDAASARLHEWFLGEPGPTDVITFAHGEIVIGAAVAARQARAHRQTLERELRRYVIHGFLHLNGHEDDEPASAAAMWEAQERILRRAQVRGV